MAGEVGVDAADRHGVGFLVRGAGGLEQRRANARETVGLHDRHRVPRLKARAGRRVLLVVAGMVSKRWHESKWQRHRNRGALTPPPVTVPLRGIWEFCLARKIAGPGQRGLIGEAFKEHLRAIGVASAISQFQTCAPIGRHRLLHALHLERRTPPPCRRRRSLVLGDGAPSDELIHGTFKLHIRSPMHGYLRTRIISGFATAANVIRWRVYQRAASEPMGRVHSQPPTPPSTAENAPINITLRNARSNAAMTLSSTPASPASTAFTASLACAGGAVTEWEKLANSTAPSAATAKRPATRARALLMPDAMPARASPPDAITGDVSGGTIMIIPISTTLRAVKTPVPKHFLKSTKASRAKPQAAMMGPAL